MLVPGPGIESHKKDVNHSLYVYQHRDRYHQANLALFVKSTVRGSNRNYVFSFFYQNKISNRNIS